MSGNGFVSQYLGSAFSSVDALDKTTDFYIGSKNTNCVLQCDASDECIVSMGKKYDHIITLGAFHHLLPCDSNNATTIIYNPAEDNSGIIVRRFKSECEKQGLTSVTATVSNQNEIRQTLVSLVGKIDVLYAPTDATVQSAFPMLIGTANELNIPVFNCEEGTVKDGALFSVGFNYSDLGRISADMAIEILVNGKSPSEMPIRLADRYQLFYNSTQINRYRNWNHWTLNCVYVGCCFLVFVF